MEPFRKQVLMKSIFRLSLLLPLALHAQGPRFRDAATHDELVKTHRQAQQENPMQKLAEPKGPAPSTVEPIPDLISSSDILSFNGLATLVPKRAILNQPSDLASRINNYKQGSRIVGWLDFLQSNRGWITTLEVSRAQAEGTEPIDEEIVENYRKSSNLVVATYKSGPISVMPLREPEKNEKSKQTENPTTNKQP